MRKLMLIAIAIVSLAIAGAARAKTVAVTITKNGYVPKGVTTAAGDMVQFTNSDTVAHQIVFKTTTGVACVPSPLVLQPTQSGTCTFQTAGKFAYSDPNRQREHLPRHGHGERRAACGHADARGEAAAGRLRRQGHLWPEHCRTRKSVRTSRCSPSRAGRPLHRR